MTNEDYLKQRLYMLETAVRNLMLMLIEVQPHLRHQINDMGTAWDKELDKLDAAQSAAPTGPAQPDGEKQ